MNKEKDDELDKLFRKGLEDPVNEAAFREADWDAMEQMLDKPKKRSAILFWLPVLGSVAALLLVFIGYLFLKLEVVKPTKHGQIAVVRHSNPNSSTVDQKKDNTGTSGGPARQVADSSKQKDLTPANYANNPGKPRHGQKSKSFFTLSGGDRRDTTGHSNETIALKNLAKRAQPVDISNQAIVTNPVIANNNVSNKKGIGTTDDKKDLGTADNKKNLVTADAGKKDLSTTDDHKNIVTADGKRDPGTADNSTKQKGDLAANNMPSSKETTSPAKVKGLSKSSNKAVLALSVLASSDLNGVNSSFQQSKVGGNFGAMFSVTFAKKWTISTGAQYAIKPYLTNFNNYHTAYQFKNQPSSVNANCRMLDIPLNVNYQVYSIRGNKITLGTGLSSYFMLREDYKFNYSGLYNSGPSSYSVVNKNRNILSVLNLDATYAHQINSKVGITLQPYLKLPLTDVGASQVRLQTTGVALGLSWNLNASPKPK